MHFYDCFFLIVVVADAAQIVMSLMKHVESESCQVNSYSCDNFEVIGREPNPYLLLVKESILISTSKPDFNNNQLVIPPFTLLSNSNFLNYCYLVLGICVVVM